MRIVRPQAALHGADRENNFIVIDEYGMQYGHGYLLINAPKSSRQKRELCLDLVMDAHPIARDVLFGALYTRARLLGRDNGAAATRLEARCDIKDLELLDFYGVNGFDLDDGEELFLWDLSIAQRAVNAPDKAVVVPLRIESGGEMADLLRWVNYWGNNKYDLGWMEEAASMPVFIVLQAFIGDRRVCQAMAAGGEREAAIEMMETVPEYQRRHIATAMMLHIREMLLQRGVMAVRISAARGNIPAMKMFERLRMQWIRTTKIYPVLRIGAR